MNIKAALLDLEAYIRNQEQIISEKERVIDTLSRRLSEEQLKHRNLKLAFGLLGLLALLEGIVCLIAL